MLTAALGTARLLPGVFKLIPREVWYALAIALAIAFVRNWYGNQIEAAEKRGSDAAYASIADQARTIKERADRITEGVSKILRGINDEENRRIGAGYDALRLHGPGKAACPGHSQLPVSTGQPIAPAGTGNAAVDRVPYPEWSSLIAMPFDDLLKRAEQCDLNRAEAAIWREWWEHQTATWGRLQSQGTQP